MKKALMLFIAFIYSHISHSQNSFKATIKDSETKEPIIGAIVYIKELNTGSTADINGNIELNHIPDGKQVLTFSFVGYAARTDTFNFPLIQSTPIEIFLSMEEEEMEEVVVSSTRSNRSISDIPTRIESITAEELDEKATMQPGNIKMALTESTGIQTQQTSATSANASIRIQGLDGKYTQLLKDGFPLYSGFAGGLSIMQIPPLDLKRIEVIKGSASTLYGGGAIAGLINLITKDPSEKREITFMANGTSAKGLDLSGYYNQKFKKIGVTLFAASNTQEAYDPNKDNLSDIPKYARYTFNPRIFYYINPSATISLGLNTSFENRLGGDMQVINNKADSTHSYFERNISNRYSTQLKFEKNFKNKSILTAKNSITNFARSIGMSNYNFSGQQIASYSEITYLLPKEKTEWVTGLNVWTDQFNESANSNLNKRDYFQTTIGAFIQNHWNISNKFITEIGLRGDFISVNAPNQSISNKAFLLPRISLLYKATSKLTTRLGGGLGYKAPTIFSEEAETQGFQNIQPINFQTCNTETSIGSNFDINYRTKLTEEITLTINEMLFYTQLNSPLVLNYNSTNNTSEFTNGKGFLTTQGSETNMKIKYDDIALYVGYTYIDAQRHFNNINVVNPLTAKHRLNLIAMYEVENKLRIGYEAFYVSYQTLSNGNTTSDYWIMGISAEKKFKHISVFINAENYLDTRQSKYQSMYTGTIQNPKFSEIWAPTDGFIFNGGIKIML